MTMTTHLDRILPPGRGALIIPMDHGLTMGNLPGLEDPRRLLDQLIAARVDGTLMSAGMAKQLGPQARAGGLGLTLTLDFQQWGNRAGQLDAVSAVTQASSVARAADLGADAVKLLFLWGLAPEVVRRNIELIVAAAEAAHTADLPLMLEPLWMGSPLDEAEHDEVIVHGARMALELGADILKIPAVGEGALERILTWGVPTVFLGGARQDDPSALFARIRAGIAAGARGVVVGRNVWQSPRMAEMIEALREAVGG